MRKSFPSIEIQIIVILMEGGCVGKEWKDACTCVTEQLRLLLYNPEQHQFTKKKTQHTN